MSQVRFKRHQPNLPVKDIGRTLDHYAFRSGSRSKKNSYEGGGAVRRSPIATSMSDSTSSRSRIHEHADGRRTTSTGRTTADDVPLFATDADALAADPGIGGPPESSG